MTSERPPTIDPQAAARWQQRRQPESPWLHEEVARRMQERLDWITHQPGSWVHWEPLRGGLQAHGLLAQRYPQAACWLVESSPARGYEALRSLARPWWHPARWRTPAPRLHQIPQDGVQMLWANMALHMAPDPQALMARWHRTLAVDGFLMFSCFGPDTLRELRAVYADLNWPAPAHQYTDMHDWGDMLVQAGFAEPVMDMERIELTFATPQRLLQELRELGRNLHPDRYPGLRGRGWHAALLAALAERLAQPEQGGQLKLSFEIIYGHAFKPEPRVAVMPHAQISLEEMRLTLRRSRGV